MSVQSIDSVIIHPATSEDSFFLTEFPPSSEDSPSDSQTAFVLIPNPEIDGEQLKLRIIALGLDRCKKIVLLGTKDGRLTLSYPDLSRLAYQLRVVGMQATLKQLSAGEGWIQAIERLADPGDYVVCHAEYRGEKLSREMDLRGLVPLVMAGLYPKRSRRWARGAQRVFYEVIPLILVAAFFWLQVQISAQTTGILNSVLLMFSVLSELGLLVLWSLFQR